MERVVRQELRGTVAILEIDAPPVNALGAGVRTALAAALADVAADPRARAVVIRGAGRMFSAGADIAEFGTVSQAPSLARVVAALEAMGKPVVAALHGVAFGGGLELALGAHCRVALVGAQLGLPEVTLGILPGAGGTQRLPRLIGAGAALRMMLTGQPVNAAEALDLGLVDRVVDGEVTEAAVALAEELARAAPPPLPTRARRDGFRDAVTYATEVQAARALIDPDRPATGRIVACVAAARLLPFDEGIEMERAAFRELVASPQAAALREAFREERRRARAAKADPARKGESR